MTSDHRDDIRYVQQRRGTREHTSRTSGAEITVPNLVLRSRWEQAKHPLVSGEETTYPTSRRASTAKLNDQVDEHNKVVLIAAEGGWLDEFVEANLTQRLNILNSHSARSLGRGCARLDGGQEILQRSLHRAQ